MRIDLSNIENEEHLHSILAKEFDFPSFYGNNWDAFRDSISGLIELPKVINFEGSNSLKNKHPLSYKQLRGCFDELEKEYPEIKCSVTWN